MVQHICALSINLTLVLESGKLISRRHCPQFEQTSLMYASGFGHVDIMQQLKDKGAIVDGEGEATIDA